MKIAKFTRHKYQDNKREMYAIWLQLQDETREYFYGPVTSYRAYGWERHAVNTIIDAMKLALAAAGFDVINNA